MSSPPTNEENTNDNIYIDEQLFSSVQQEFSPQKNEAFMQKHDASKDKISIYKIGKNEEIYYGDGGQNDMKWDIYVCDKLKTVNNSIISTLRKELIELAKTNNDWRDGEPIQNIIDPDLYVYKFYHKQSWLDEYKKQFDQDRQDDYEEYDQMLQDDPNDDWAKKNHPKTRWKKLQENDEKGFFIRRKYQWLSSQFIEDKNAQKIKICSPIHNISPRAKYSSIYSGIEHVFSKMLPLFNKFESFRNRKLNEFQVIVKSQRYEIDDMSGYNGHWHQEGLTENIIIVGLYYFELTDGLIGGNMRFRNLRQPDDMYAEHCDKPIVHEANVNEGTAIAFDNIDLVHRVRMLKNKVNDKNKRYRSFLAFFIVDPEKPIKSTKEISTLKKEEYIDVIMKNTVIKSKDIAVLICDYGSCGYTENEAKKLRKLNIEVRKKPTTKGKWATYHFGNCGEQMWFTHGRANPNEYGLYVDEVYFKTTTNSEL